MLRQRTVIICVDVCVCVYVHRDLYELVLWIKLIAIFLILKNLIPKRASVGSIIQ